jgi:hypothetical protein
MSPSFATGSNRRWRSGFGHYILLSALLGILLFVLLWFLMLMVIGNSRRAGGTVCELSKGLISFTKVCMMTTSRSQHLFVRADCE